MTTDAAAADTTTSGGGTVAAAVRDAAALTGRTELVVGDPRGSGWTPYRELLRPENLAGLLDAAVTLCGSGRTQAARTAATTLMAGDLATAVANPIATALICQHRALLLDPEDLAVRIGAEGVDALAVASPCVAVLPTDPLAGHDGTVVVPELPAVRAAATGRYAALLAPLFELVCTAARRGPRGLWTDAAERLASAVLLTLRTLDRPEQAPAEVAALLACAPPQLRRTVTWVDVSQHGRRMPWKRRTVCCLAYQTPRWAAQYCATCPLVRPEETVRRITEWLNAPPER